MFLNAVTDWVFNFYWDSFNRIFIAVIDNILYSLMGFLYKVFLIIGTFDLFGGYSSGTESAMQIYQDFTKRIYSVIGIVVMFILAYQIILFVIDPDKGLKESKKLVTNIIKGIILTIIAPLVFHYMAQIQYHVLVSDNLIWNIVLGEGASSSDNVIESGNTMASMLFISVFHPIGTEYSDFYNSDGSLKPPGNGDGQACNHYLGGDMSQDTISRTFVMGGTGAAIGFIIGGPPGSLIGGAIGSLVGWISNAENATSTCDFYYWQLYLNGIDGSQAQDVKPNAVTSITNYSDSKVYTSNKANALSKNTALVDEIAQENNMEYYYFSPLGAAVIIFFLVAYTLDIAVRAFKLAFLQMIAPIPILLGTIPKNEKIYSSWKDHYIKTYIDIFVRVFVMAFIALMIKLLPAFLDAMMGVLNAASSIGNDNKMLKAVTFFALIIGLLRASKEIPDLISDLAKNASGLLSGIELRPTKSFGKVKEAIDYQKGNLIKASKPFGAVAGAALGAKSAVNRVKSKDGKWYDKGLAALRGIQVGGKQGFTNGLQKGSLTNAMSMSNALAENDLQERKKRGEEFKKLGKDIREMRSQGKDPIHAVTSAFWQSDFLNNVTQSRIGQFQAVYGGSTVGLDTSILYDAGNAYKNASAGIIQSFDKAGTKAKADTAVWDRTAKSKIEQKNGQYTTQWSNQTITGATKKDVLDEINRLSKQYIKDAEVDALEKQYKTVGAQGIQDNANSIRNLNSQYFDSLGAYPGLQKTILDASKKIGTSADFKEANDLLTKLNNGKAIDYVSQDANSVAKISKLLSDDKFVKEFNSLNAGQQEIINKQLATYFHDVSKAQDDVSTAISNIKGGLAGTEVNYFTNRSINNLASKPSSDKK